MTDYPFMPVDVAALIADTETMSAEVFGAYVRLLSHMWLHQGWVPDDDRDLIRMTKVHPPHWKRVKERLARCLIFEDGMVSQKRLLKERARLAHRSIKGHQNRDSRPRGYNNKKRHASSNEDKHLSQDFAENTSPPARENYNYTKKEKEKKDANGAATTGSPGLGGRSPIAPSLPQMAEVPPATHAPLTAEQEAERMERLKNDWTKPPDHLFAKLKHH